ncbi:GMC family oxidoreductase N-terminal domain-containing protein [Sphingomonas cannabina]|uniref:GMC family oxidoreductase n=1 Tax=Sphingomonas cannabina TaxID=2899123 RepID=UPI001F2A6138|nr:GMC family oxidoreductase N-terminal domain-containing protein [Sphingomonas cannabina]UIJ45415.1 GMC family oxidoreductase N-terminal domain-containing protein [Sphingomonas cannabina]
MDDADIIVIGCGSGGAAAAGRLSEGGKYRVAVLEAGGRNASATTLMPAMLARQTPKTNWAYETVPQPGLGGRRGYQPRGKGLGGSSAINAMLYVRGNPWDYDNWAALGCTGWSYADVLPVFRRAEHNVRGADAWHGGDGPLWVSEQLCPHPASFAFIEAAASLQLPRNDDFNGERQEGVGLYQVTQRGGERWTSARAYLGEARPNLAILTDVVAERILFEDGRAVGVAYRRKGERRTIRAKGAVILAGGVFATPQLLMLSGIGEGRQLAEHGIPVTVDRPAVGANLQDHCDYTAIYESDAPGLMGKSLKGNLRALGAIAQWHLKRTGAMTTPFAESGAFVTVDPASPAPDIQYHFVIAPVDDHGRATAGGHGYSCHACVLRPESRGSVRLASADVADAPLIDPAFLADPRDMALLKQGVRLMYRIMAAPPLAAYGGRERYPVDPDDDEALEAMIRARSDTIYHPVGTARMGSDADAVCDPRLRVRGVDGLYVADASIMPRLVSGNTNAPTIMIGERCADFVRADLG